MIGLYVNLKWENKVKVPDTKLIKKEDANETSPDTTWH